MIFDSFWDIIIISMQHAPYQLHYQPKYTISSPGIAKSVFNIEKHLNKFSRFVSLFFCLTHSQARFNDDDEGVDDNNNQWQLAKQ